MNPHSSTTASSAAPATPLQSALLTDLYQLSMAHNYWQLGRHEAIACCQLFFRQHPFGGNYTVNNGLHAAIEYLQNWHFQANELSYLSQLCWPDGSKRFSTKFLDYLAGLRFSGELDAIPEGTLVFPQQPLLRIQAPIIQAQILETALMNAYSLASLVATKAHRIRCAAASAPIAEFGLRRAQGPDGGLTASRAAYLGGVDSTSNVLAGQRYNIPLTGTMSHSWIMSFASEGEAFAAAARCMGSNNVLLVDTYSTLAGVKQAIVTAQAMQQQGHKLAAIRLDSGDLAALSIAARDMLDRAGLHDTKIMASGNIDEHVIQSLQQQHAAIDAWGVGTKLATADGQGALNLAYKLSAMQQPDHSWRYCYKRSDTHSKTSLAGRVQVRRNFNLEHNPPSFQNDLLYELDHHLLPAKAAANQQDLLQPIMRQGALVYEQPDLSTSREFLTQQYAAFSPWHVADTYPLHSEQGLQQLNKHR